MCGRIGYRSASSNDAIQIRVQRIRLASYAGSSGVSGPEEADCRSLIERAVAELGTLDILVNNAAYQMTREEIEQIPDGEREHTFRTDVSCPQSHPSRASALDRPGPRRPGS